MRGARFGREERIAADGVAVFAGSVRRSAMGASRMALGTVLTLVLLEGSARAQATRPAGPEVAKPPAADVAKPAAPDVAKPPAPDVAKPAAQEAPKPGDPAAALKPSQPATVAKSMAPQPSSPLQEKIKTSSLIAAALVKRVWAQRDKALSAVQAAQYEDQINSWTLLLTSFRERADDIERRKLIPAEKEAAENDEAALAKEIAAADKALAAITLQLDALVQATGWKLVETLLAARCATAICFDNGTSKNWLGIEPLVELPIGKSSAVGHTSLTNWVNNHDLRVDLAAGVRVWFFRDVISLSVYLSKPLNDAPVRLAGSPFIYPGASIRRPYPGVALGLFFDSIWVGFDRDELRNSDGQGTGQAGSGALNPAYPPNEVISSAWTFTVALQPVTAFRSAIGTAVQSAKGGSK